MRSTRLARRTPAVIATVVAASALVAASAVVVGLAASAQPAHNAPPEALTLDVTLYVVNPWRTL
jgi:hypothetical protein